MRQGALSDFNREGKVAQVAHSCASKTKNTSFTKNFERWHAVHELDFLALVLSMRPEFLALRADTAELNRRRLLYVEEIERAKFFYNKISLKVEELGRPYMHPQTGIITLPKFKKEKPPARIGRLLDRMKKQSLAFEKVRTCRLVFYGFELGLQQRAAPHIQRLWRGSRPRVAKILSVGKAARLKELARMFLTFHHLPKVQRTMIQIIQDHHKAVRIKLNNASRTLTKNMRTFHKKMDIYRWCMETLNARIPIHRKRVWASHVIQSHYRKRLRYKHTLEQLMRYSNIKLEDERIALMGESDGERHKASNVIQKWIPPYLKKKHDFIEHLWPFLHPQLAKFLLKFDLAFEAHHVLRSLQQASWKGKEAIQLERIKRMRLENTSVLARSMLSSKRQPNKRERKINERNDNTAQDPFNPDPLPPTVLPMTGLFPHVGPTRPSDFSRIVRFTSWNFWLEIEVLNKEYWIPTLKQEDEEDFAVARGFIRWYIGESPPVRRPILVKYPVKGHSRKRIKQLESASQMYGYNGFKAKKTEDLLPREYCFTWIPKEALCERCWSFKNETPNGFCAECDLAPSYTRVKENTPSKMRNRFHLTRSYSSIRCDIGLFIVHCLFRCNTPPLHVSRSQPFFQVWKSAVKGAHKYIAQIERVGCTTIGQLKTCRLLDIGIPARLSMMIRKMLWHIDSVLNWMIDMCPLRPSLIPPPKPAPVDGWDPNEDREFRGDPRELEMRPFSAPAATVKRKGVSRAVKSASRRVRSKPRPETSPAMVSIQRRSKQSRRRWRKKHKHRNRSPSPGQRRLNRRGSLESDREEIVGSPSFGTVGMFFPYPKDSEELEGKSISGDILGSFEVSPQRRPGTSQGLERSGTVPMGAIPPVFGHEGLRPGTAPIKIDEMQGRENRHGQRRPRIRSASNGTRNQKQYRSQSAARQITRLPPAMPPRPGTIGGSPIRMKAQTPISTAIRRSSSRGNDMLGQNTVSRPKYTRPLTAPIWRDPESSVGR